MGSFEPGTVLHVLLIYAGALLCGMVFDWVNLPLPWMIGALVFSTVLRVSDFPVEVPQVTRPIGQVLIAATVGLSFTPEAVTAVSLLLVPMVGAAVLTVAAGFAVAQVMVQMSRVAWLQAVLASVPMGPVEAANLAKRNGLDPTPVIFSQTLRIVALVLIIPPVLVALDGTVQDPQMVLRAEVWNAGGAMLLVLCATLGALLARALRISNPFFVGSLAGAAGAAAVSLPVTALPYPLLVAAQTFLGVWLGAVFDRKFLRSSAGFFRAAVASTALMIGLCVLLGLAFAWATGIPWYVMILATAPGSVTEMALTAKILQDGVALVTAFHLVRIFIILPLAPLIVRLATRMR
ncbi:MAG: AbrB family transcriptional regulator [Alkalilacustris sp.]